MVPFKSVKKSLCMYTCVCMYDMHLLRVLCMYTCTCEHTHAWPACGSHRASGVAPPFQPFSLRQSISLSLPGAACPRLAGPRAMRTMISGFL